LGFFCGGGEKKEIFFFQIGKGFKNLINFENPHKKGGGTLKKKRPPFFFFLEKTFHGLIFFARLVLQRPGFSGEKIFVFILRLELFFKIKHGGEAFLGKGVIFNLIGQEPFSPLFCEIKK